MTVVMDRRLSEKNVHEAQDGNALQFASGSLQQDKRVVLVAAAQDSDALRLHPSRCSRTLRSSLWQ
jgi:hypothetical protein